MPGEKLRALLSEEDISRIIEMAWEDRTSFDAIKANYGMTEPDIKALMRTYLKRGSYILWRKRVNGRATKHQALRDPSVTRAYSPGQYKITSN